LRFAANAEPEVLVISGEADLTNREALAAVLDPLAAMERTVTVDVAAVEFADAGAAQLLAGLARRRAGRRTEIRCSPAIDRLLRIIGADHLAQVTIGASQHA
jgi:anti-anti-sigma regulatory factor